MSMMDDTIEQIVKAAKEAVKCYGGDDQYMILEEVSPPPPGTGTAKTHLPMKQPPLPRKKAISS